MAWKERLIEYSTVNPETGCREWDRATNNRGYGVTYVEGKNQLAHRAAWYAKYGKYPRPDMVTDHICENKRCINVDHLRELPNHLNLRRAIPRGDAETEARRKRQRIADAKRRGNYKYKEEGGG